MQTTIPPEIKELKQHLQAGKLLYADIDHGLSMIKVESIVGCFSPVGAITVKDVFGTKHDVWPSDFLAAHDQPFYFSYERKHSARRSA